MGEFSGGAEDGGGARKRPASFIIDVFRGGMDLLASIYLWIAFAAVVGFIISVFVDVVYRQVLTRPLLGPADIALFCFVWSVMTAAAVAVRKGLHFVIDFFPGRFNRNAQKLRSILIEIAVLLFFATLTVFGIETAAAAMNRTFPMSGYPIGWAVAAIPACGVASVLFLLERITMRLANIPLDEESHLIMAAVE